MYREAITVDDVLASRMVAYPMHLLECCLVTDGGGALVVTSAARAAAIPGPKPPVYVLGTGEAAETPLVSMMADFTRSEAFRRSSAAAFAESGLGVGDVDHLMVYDAFAHLPALRARGPRVRRARRGRARSSPRGTPRRAVGSR